MSRRELAFLISYAFLFSYISYDLTGNLLTMGLVLMAFAHGGLIALILLDEEDDKDDNSEGAS